MVARKGYKLTEVGEIPKDWEVKKIETVIHDISMGPFGSDIKVTNFVSHGVPVLNGFNLRSMKLTDVFTNFVTEEKAYSLKKAVAVRGDVIVTHRGTLGQISYIPKDSSFAKYVISQSQFRVQFDIQRVAPSWIVMFFRSDIGARTLLEGKGHTGVPALAQPTTKFRQLFIPLPPTKEQTAIATALSDADALIDALEQCIAKKRHIKQGAMQELLTGKRRLPGFEGEWKAIPFGELATPSCSRFTTSSAQQTNFCIELEHIGQGTGLLLGYTHTTKLSSLKSCFEEGDVLFGKLRAYLRKYWRATRSGVCSTEIWVLKSATEKVISEYVYQVVQTDSFIETASTAYGTHMPRSDWRIVKNLEIQLPPTLDEQAAIAAVLTAMDDEIAALEAKLSKARQIKAGMMQELLTGRIRLV